MDETKEIIEICKALSNENKKYVLISANALKFAQETTKTTEKADADRKGA